MTTYNTGNPIGSTDSRDRLDNSENFDIALNTHNATWVDRLGVTRDSFEGRLAKGSFYRVGTFAAGYTLTNMRQTLEYDGHEYSWAGTFPKSVAAGSTPATSGGIGAGAWVDRTDVSLRLDIKHAGGNCASDVLALKADQYLLTPEVGSTVKTGSTVWKRIASNSAGRAITTASGLFFIPLNGVWASDYGALGLGADSESTDTSCLQDTLTDAGNHGWSVKIPTGNYYLTSGLKVPFSSATKKGVAIRGDGPPVNSYKNPDNYNFVKFTASPNVTWSSGSSLLTSDAGGVLSVDRICFIGDNSATDRVDDGVVTGLYQASRGVISDCGFYRCKIGIDGNAGFSTWRQCYFGKNGTVGAALRKGDSQITNCYFHDTRRDDTTSTGSTGAALYLEKANNINITGGKIEASMKGIYVYRTQGVNITGINFDFCRTHIWIVSELEEEAYICRSINISACRFLSAASRFITITNSTSFVSTGVISGCSFARGNSDAYDNNSTGLLTTGTYPSVNFILLSGPGEMDWVLNSCNVRLSATTPSIYFSGAGTLTLSGNTTPYISVDLGSGTGRVVRVANHYLMTAPPTTGTWNQGDVIDIRYPASKTTQSYVCVLGGTFGETSPVFEKNGILGSSLVTAISDLTAAPTMSDFNNLLAKLRSAGLMSY